MSSIEHIGIGKPNVRNTEAVNHYASYLAERIADMKFVDLDNLKEYLKSHLAIFFNEALDDSVFSQLDKRRLSLEKENQQLHIDRIEMEEQLVKTRSDKSKKIWVDMQWYARCQYAFKMKGLQLKTNCDEIARISKLQRREDKKKNIEMSIDKDRSEQKLFLTHVKEIFGEEKYIQLWSQVREKHGI